MGSAYILICLPVLEEPRWICPQSRLVCLSGRAVLSLTVSNTATCPLSAVCVCETYIGKPFGTRVVPQFTTEVAKPLTQ
jgi:hypothetical protein